CGSWPARVERAMGRAARVATRPAAPMWAPRPATKASSGSAGHRTPSDRSAIALSPSDDYPGPETPSRKEAPVAMDRTFQAKNERERERLKALVGRLGEAELRRPLSHAWPAPAPPLPPGGGGGAPWVRVASGPLRGSILRARFERPGAPPSPADIEVVNESVQALGQSIPPRAAAALAIDAAERVARRLETLPDRILQGLAAAGDPFTPRRHNHWAEHLDEIERALR